MGITVGKYKLLKFLGAGKIGYVYRARHRDLPDCDRALKLTFDRLKSGWKVELRKVAKLALVEGVVHFHDLGTETVTHKGQSRFAQYTVWDYIPPGENLKKYLTRVKSVPTSFLLAVVEAILRVLNACKEEGVPRHGDLHTGNILIGDSSLARLDDMLQPRAPVYVSDFGYGTTGGVQQPKDDYAGLAYITNDIIGHIDYATASATDRQILKAIQQELTKLLREQAFAERQPPLQLLQVIASLKRGAQSGVAHFSQNAALSPINSLRASADASTVGSFQVTEMIGDRWELWKKLFVPTVPARSKILSLDIPTVVTGPRGCGKTMLFRRLSERLVVECGDVDDLRMGVRFVAYYVNANDIADAFAHFPEQPTPSEEGRLTCYANLCVLGDVLAVQSARMGKFTERATETLLTELQRWLIEPGAHMALVGGEDRLERYRTILEQTKWRFPGRSGPDLFPGYADLSQHRWLSLLLGRAPEFCPSTQGRNVLLFIDDYSTPRVTPSMQRVLNRLFLQRSPHFLAKLATEAASTFVQQDSSGKNLEDGDDYQLVDMGEESLFLQESERLAFLDEVFKRRLESDQRIPDGDFA